MAGTSKNSIHFGEESTFDTPVAASVSYPSETDEWAHEITEIEIPEIRAGQQLTNDAASISYPDGGTGSVSLAFANTGMGKLLKNGAGTSSITGTVQTHEGGPDAADGSLTAHVVRSTVDSDTPLVYRFSGCQTNSFEITHSAKDILKTKFDFIFASADKTGTVPTAAYPADSKYFLWRQGTITVGGVDLDYCKDYTLTFNSNLFQDADYIKTGAKSKPGRVGLASVEGSLGLELDAVADDLYDLWLAQTPSDLEISYVNGTNSVTITIPKIKFKNVAPQMSADAFTVAPVEFVAVDPGSASAAWTIEIDGPDTSI